MRREQKPKAARGETSAEKSAEKKNRVDNSVYIRKLGQLIRARSPGVTQLGEGNGHRSLSSGRFGRAK